MFGLLLSSEKDCSQGAEEGPLGLFNVPHLMALLPLLMVRSEVDR
jgi:hypothetical protein